MANQKRIPRPVALFILLICVTTAIDSAAKSREQPSTGLAGKFVAQIDGPPLTGFGLNQQSFVFEMFAFGEWQFVTVSNTFLLYESHVPRRVLDYSKLYEISAVRNEECDDTLENISRRFVFDAHGNFVEMKYALMYAKNLPSLTLPWKNTLPCYVVTSVEPGAKVVRELDSETAAP